MPEQGVIVYIVTETRQNYETGSRHPTKVRLEQISGQPCLVLYYQEVRLDRLLAMGCRAVVFGGYSTALDDHPLDSFAGVHELVRDGELPTIGLCGGHQVIAELYAAHNDAGLTRMSGYPMRRLRPDEPDLNADYNPGWFKEWGFYPIRIVRDDPLFDGLPNPFMANEKHMREVKALPADFELLASTDEVRVQAYRHRQKMLYGTQFHCENWTDHYPAGRRILVNFFRLAGVVDEAHR